MERRMKSKSLSLLLVFWLVFMLVFPIGSFESKASGGVTYLLPVTYYTSLTKTTTVNVVMSMSTTTVTKGTVITLIGIPSNSYVSDGGYEHVLIREALGKTRSWGYDSWESVGEEIIDGTVSFVVDNAEYPVTIIFGEWFDDEGNGGFDNIFDIAVDGTVTETMLQQIILPVGDETVAQALAASTAATTSTAAGSSETGYVIDKYLADGEFTDFADYGVEMGATVPKANGDWNIYYLFGDYFVTVGTTAQDPEYAYIGIGRRSDQNITYCYLIPYNNVPVVKIYDTGASMPVSVGYVLEDTINYMKAHPDPEVKPVMDGITWIGWDEW